MPERFDSTITEMRKAPGKSTGEILLDIPEEILKSPIYLVKGIGYVTFNGIYRNPLLYKLASYAFSFKPGTGVVPVASYGSNSGVYLGLAYKHFDLFQQHDYFRIKLAYSTHDYQRYQLDFKSPQLFGDGVGFNMIAAYRYKPRENFHGIGSASKLVDEFAITVEESQVSPAITWSPADWLNLSTRAGYKKINIFDGKDPTLENSLSAIVEELDMDPNQLKPAELISLGGSVEFDWRDSKGQPSRGGRQILSAAYNSGSSRDLDISYWESRIDIAHYLNVYKKRILAARIQVKSIDPTGSTSQLPFYLLSSLGGVDDLRGYRKSRFIDNDMILATLEYRYPIWTLIDAYLFFDYGRVTPSLTDALDSHDWHESYGLGLRVWRDDGVLVNFLVGRSIEGTRLFFELGSDW